MRFLNTVSRKSNVAAVKMAAVIFMVLTALHGIAQNSFRTGKWGIETNYQIGPIIKHSKKIKEVPKELSQGFEVSYFRKSLGEKPWMKPLNFPEYGVNFNYFHFGEAAVFGQAFSLMGYAKFYIVRSKVANLYARIGGGLGYVTKYYNYETNPRNNILSGPINMAVQIRLGLEWKLHPQVLLNTAFTFSHFSNSSAKQPNYGINITAATVGLKVFPKVSPVSYNCVKEMPKKKNEVIIKYSLGLQETYGFNGPISFTQVGTVCYARYTSFGNKFFGGLTMEYYPVVRNFLVYNEIADKKTAVRKSFTGSVILGDEILLGRFGMFYGLGIYLFKTPATLTPVYFKVGGNLYYARFGKDQRYKMFVGMNVKSHLSVAQYWEVSTGICL
ncbi:MAG: acyloxyacyl hydrolase [Chitinophagales bacterium]